MPTATTQLPVTVFPGLLDFTRQVGGQVDVIDERRVVVMTITALPDAARKRPQDMPRAQRPKVKLSRRQQVKARRAKLVPSVD